MSKAGDNVKVYVRVRPVIDQEKSSTGLDLRPCLSVDRSNHQVLVESAGNSGSKVFTYDEVADQSSTQEDVFRKVGKPITDNCMAGYNGTIFAYGQTGSGKTFTMQGVDAEAGAQAPKELRGLIPRTFEYLWDLIEREERVSGGKRTFLVKASFIEIYNDAIYDLLDSKATASSYGGGLKLHEDVKRGIFIDGANEEIIGSAEEAGALLAQGAANRTVAATAKNIESSRSHSVFTLTIESKEMLEGGLTNIKFSRLNLIDLAGSERQRDTAASGQRLKEAGSINRALSALGNVISALVDIAHGRSRHVPYRDSKLTFLLKDSLGGNAKTHIIATVSPVSACYGETLSTLKFSQRAKLIRNCATVNEDTAGNVAELKAEIRRLKSQIDGELPAGSVTSGGSAPGVIFSEGSGDEALLAKALERAAAAEGEKQSAAARAEMAMRRVERLENCLLCAKMLVRIRDAQLGHAPPSDEESAALVSDTQEGQMIQELEALRWQREHSPELLRLAMDNMELREDLEAANAGPLLSSHGDLKEYIADLSARLATALGGRGEPALSPEMIAELEAKHEATLAALKESAGKEAAQASSTIEKLEDDLARARAAAEEAENALASTALAASSGAAAEEQLVTVEANLRETRAELAATRAERDRALEKASKEAAVAREQAKTLREEANAANEAATQAAEASRRAATAAEEKAAEAARVAAEEGEARAMEAERRARAAEDAAGIAQARLEVLQEDFDTLAESAAWEKKQAASAAENAAAALKEAEDRAAAAERAAAAAAADSAAGDGAAYMIAEELRGERDDALANLSKTKEALAKVEGDLQEAKERASGASQERDRLAAELEDARGAVKSAEGALEELRERVEGSEAEKDELIARISELQDEAQEASERAKKVAAEANEAHAAAVKRAEAAEASLAVAEADKAAHVAAMAQWSNTFEKISGELEAAAAAHAKELADTKARHAAVVKKLRSTLNSRGASETEAQKRVTELEAALEAASARESRYTELAAKYEELRSGKVDALSSAQSALRRAEAGRMDAETELNHMRRALAEAEAKVEAAQAEAQASAANKEAEAEASKLQSELLQLQAELSSSLGERAELLDEMKRVKAEEVAAFESAQVLKGRLETEAEGKLRLEEELKMTKRALETAQEENARLTGHGNLRQKIQHHRRIKEENNDLKKEKAALLDALATKETLIERWESEASRYRRMAGASPGDGRPMFDLSEEERLADELKKKSQELVDSNTSMNKLVDCILELPGSAAVGADKADEQEQGDGNNGSGSSIDTSAMSRMSAALSRLHDVSANVIRREKELRDREFKLRVVEKEMAIARASMKSHLVRRKSSLSATSLDGKENVGNVSAVMPKTPTGAGRLSTGSSNLGAPFTPAMRQALLKSRDE